MVYTVKEKGENLTENPPSPHPSLWFKNPYRNLKSENSQDYVQKPQRNCTFMNSASVYLLFIFATAQKINACYTVHPVLNLFLDRIVVSWCPWARRFCSAGWSVACRRRWQYIYRGHIIPSQAVTYPSNMTVEVGPIIKSHLKLFEFPLCINQQI